MDRNISITQDSNGDKVVIINDILFSGKRSIRWGEVKKYLKQYVGEFYTIMEDNEIIFIGNDLPDEYTGSKYTYTLKGTNAKAKANAAQGIPELVEIAVNRHFRENTNSKHNKEAKNGWYRYDSQFALPIYSENGEIERYNKFHASMLIRHDANGKKYLYDIIDIKKETSNPLEQ
ncbi:MAG: hypothetical protein Q4F29_08505 [Lachnospiraceae bacterium]|nr:hypothetical protein [Lachnospiraceae bacterium]